MNGGLDADNEALAALRADVEERLMKTRKQLAGYIETSLYQLLVTPCTESVRTDYVFGRIFKVPQPNSLRIFVEMYSDPSEVPVNNDVDKYEAPKTAVELIAAERARQIDEGFTPARDRRYTNYELTMAAMAYVLYAGCAAQLRDHKAPACWPWDAAWFKPGDGNEPRQRIRELTKAGALIAAEIERLQQLQAKIDHGFCA